LSASQQQQQQQQKPTLLSPSQKRANHIQSEQKRRANIRRGYEALCEVVPTLREAIKLEESGGRAASVEEDKPAKGRGKRRRSGKGVLNVEEEKAADGRAGPRSENVVLSKTIDYLHSLLSDRSDLMNRLNYARSSLVPGHPALLFSPAHLDEKGIPLWEREWGGGSGWVSSIGSGDGGDGDGGEDGEGDEEE